MRQPKWQRRAEDRPREICTAALEVFSEKGFAAARLDEIARRAGVSKGTLYLYFKDKEDLFRAVVRDTMAPNIGAIATVAATAEAPFADIVRMLLPNFADIAGRVPVGGVAKMVIGESRNFPELAKVWHDEIASKALGLIAGMIAAAQKRGEVRPGVAPVRELHQQGRRLDEGGGRVRRPVRPCPTGPPGPARPGCAPRRGRAPPHRTVHER